MSSNILGTNLLDNPQITCLFNSTLSITGYTTPNHGVSCPTPATITGRMEVEIILDGVYSLGTSNITFFSILCNLYL